MHARTKFSQAMQALTNFCRHYLLAVQFFTRIPVTGKLAAWVGFSPAMLRASAAHFPGVGLLVGALAASVYCALALLLPSLGAAGSLFSPFVAAVLSTVFTVLLTGGFHEDGLADVADGLGGSSERQRALEIMKDSRVGAFGAMALVLALLSKVLLLGLLGAASQSLSSSPAALLSVFSPSNAGLAWMATALIAGHTVSRLMPLLLIASLPYADNASTASSVKAKPLADSLSKKALLAAFLWCFSALALCLPAQAAMHLIAGCGLALLALLWLWRLFRRRLQGFTGDCLGAAQQVTEIAFYLGLALALGAGW